MVGTAQAPLPTLRFLLKSAPPFGDYDAEAIRPGTTWLC